MNPREQAFLEAALMCSKYADNLRQEHPDWASVADECADLLAEQAGCDLHFYPPQKPVIDLGQDSENSSASGSIT